MAGGAFSDRGRDSSSQLRQMAITFCYCSIMAINGGTVGAFGPALETFERNTKLPQVAIGTAVLIHRLAKLGGTIVWGWYASLLQKRREQGVRLSLSPHVLMSASLLVTGVSSVLLGVTKSKRTFQVAMGVAGFCYGITDSACNLLVLWAWQHDTRRQRVHVATLNALFTSGAFITPMLVAASLHYMNGVVWPAFHALAIFGAVQAILLPLLPPPPVPYRGTAEVDEDEGGHELEALTKPSPATEGGRSAVAAGALAGMSGRDPKPPSPDPGLRVTATMMCAVCVLCCAANGCEHAVATWLAPYGVERVKAGEERMAIMTSNFWTTMSFGRVLWAIFSGSIESAWPVIFTQSGMCLLSGVCLMSTNQTVVWSGAMLIGAGVSSSFPAAVTLPPEMGVQMSPQMMTVLCLCASFGEMLFPFIVALMFQHDLYLGFGGLVLVSQAAATLVIVSSWCLLTGRLRVQGFAAPGYATQPPHAPS